MDDFIKKTMKSVGMPGLSIAIINDKQVAYHRTFGVTNINTKVAVNQETMFEAASLSKPIFAYFAMRLAEKGMLDLDKPMHQYLPHPAIDSASREQYRLITPRMILAHTTGFPNWSRGKMIKLAHAPGEGFTYSGEAYQYLAAAIGTHLKVGWQARLDSVFQEEVAKPLGLKNTFFTWNKYTAERKATGHRKNKPTNAASQGKSFGAGYSLHTEAQDYARFLLEMMDSKHLSKASIQAMLKEQNKFPAKHKIRDTGQTGWGLGFARKPMPYGMRYLHTGNNHDFQSYCNFYKNKPYGLVVFTNSDKLEAFYKALSKFLGDEF
ncbi:hypothetical protein BKI52_18285 [marine bacterium AO1-C]|nr:hypothetical protein BKI52_18285 [marine bacterium AO1-C]